MGDLLVLRADGVAISPAPLMHGFRTALTRFVSLRRRVCISSALCCAMHLWSGSDHKRLCCSSVD